MLPLSAAHLRMVRNGTWNRSVEWPNASRTLMVNWKNTLETVAWLPRRMTIARSLPRPTPLFRFPIAALFMIALMARPPRSQLRLKNLTGSLWVWVMGVPILILNYWLTSYDSCNTCYQSVTEMHLEKMNKIQIRLRQRIVQLFVFHWVEMFSNLYAGWFVDFSFACLLYRQ